jgi:hypothetical protein
MLVQAAKSRLCAVSIASARGRWQFPSSLSGTG